MVYPKWMYVKADNQEGYLSVLLYSKEQEAALGQCFDSPAKVPCKTYHEHMDEWESKEEKPKKRGKK